MAILGTAGYFIRFRIRSTAIGISTRGYVKPAADGIQKQVYSIHAEIPSVIG